jgi:hypothetical protein
MGLFRICSCSAACALGAGPCCDEKSMMAARAEAASLRADPARACGSADNDHALADATSKRDMQTLKSTLALATKLINGLPAAKAVNFAVPFVLQNFHELFVPCTLAHPLCAHPIRRPRLRLDRGLRRLVAIVWYLLRWRHCISTVSPAQDCLIR